MDDASLVIAAGVEMYRVHRMNRGPAFYDTSDTGRFNPPPAERHKYGTLYLAESDEGAFCETLGRTKYIPESEINSRALSVCTFARDLNLFTVTAAANRFRYETIDLAHDAVASCDDYLIPQRLSALVRGDGQIAFDGIAYPCRHDNTTVSVGYAIFGEPGGHPSDGVFQSCKTEPIPGELVERMIARFGFEVLPDVPLP